MPVRSRIPSRTTTLLLVATVHALVLWLLWRAPRPLREAAETITSMLLWLPASTQNATLPSAAVPRAASRAAHSGAAPAPQATPSREPGAITTPITLPPAGPLGTDWSAQLGAAADLALKKEKQARDQAGALMRKFVIEPDPLNPGHGAGAGMRWYEAGIHRIDTRSPLPVLHLNDRCVLMAFILPLCAIGHIEIHGDLFQHMITTLDEREATAQPNDVP
jgi:hypothetical protein